MSTTKNHWRIEVTAAAGDASVPVFLPARFGTATIRALPGAGGTATVQYTLDRADAVKDDPDAANWEDWDPGSVAAATSRALVSVVVALRIVAVSQPATMHVAVSFDY